MLIAALERIDTEQSALAMIEPMIGEPAGRSALEAADFENAHPVGWRHVATRQDGRKLLLAAGEEIHREVISRIGLCADRAVHRLPIV